MTNDNAEVLSTITGIFGGPILAPIRQVCYIIDNGFLTLQHPFMIAASAVREAVTGKPQTVKLFIFFPCEADMLGKPNEFHFTASFNRLDVEKKALRNENDNVFLAATRHFNPGIIEFNSKSSAMKYFFLNLLLLPIYVALSPIFLLINIFHRGSIIKDQMYKLLTSSYNLGGPSQQPVYGSNDSTVPTTNLQTERGAQVKSIAPPVDGNVPARQRGNQPETVPPT